ncbi:hypothetical protein DFP72DRAFT_1055973 [Ephemerocybe angulata]|uniref:Uncharacterized protein n=1 Tax=Ephemerocybe angulata TaxID=980116 RepID=A0A8H6H5V9_9AGAR|nr:hypothetical protein DFP72DRAFT_1055973 [Tulosesus angulatus]
MSCNSSTTSTSSPGCLTTFDRCSRSRGAPEIDEEAFNNPQNLLTHEGDTLIVYRYPLGEAVGSNPAAPIPVKELIFKWLKRPEISLHCLCKRPVAFEREIETDSELAVCADPEKRCIFKLNLSGIFKNAEGKLETGNEYLDFHP